ncbi:MAG: serine/threonine protein kinase [Verrucomicrobiaceae bacterium]|nr:MAG: serine/threonine protein kinase [Verrucomicrobiaceae bacterium]
MARESQMRSSKHLEDAIFFTAVHLTDPEQRQLFLDQACLDNTGLRSVIEEMLACQPESDCLIERGYTSVALNVEDLGETPPPPEDASATLEDERIGKIIGRYRIKEKLGEGGCGSVYLAEQDQPVKRLVAMKVIKLGMDTRSVIARFDAERQALAMMDHPNIARVLDAGATDRGQPYFVLELVRGTRITEYCDANHFETRQRLELFIQVCKAIQHAHQKGVVHRDIKPSNVLVTLLDGQPVPKVIDFGIAKAIEGRLSEETIHTQFEQLLGTPAYMSPEQAAYGGLDVDTRSDIYSLGAVLYELLTGSPPIDEKELSAAGPEEMRRILRERDPKRPSVFLRARASRDLQVISTARREQPKRLVSLMKGDLDRIIMKALDKDRSCRYDTVNGLAMDVQRFLRSEPVAARPPGGAYLLRKLIRRHAVFFTAGLAVLLALTIGLGISIWQFHKARGAELRQSQLRKIAEKALAGEELLRREAESRGKLTEAVILLRQGDHSGAARALDSMSARPRRPSLDGVTALRSVGEWLAIQGRWSEAAERFLWLLEIDKLDPWGPVTLDTQACGVVLVENGDAKTYRLFCEEAIVTHAASDNGDAVGRVLKTCLLMPPDPTLWHQLQPLGLTMGNWFGKLGSGERASWAAIPACLWAYRGGEYEKVAEIARPISERNAGNNALVPTVQTIYAMTVWQRGQSAESRRFLTKARDAINQHFSQPMAVGDGSRGQWYDWLFARILLREATILIGEEP